MGARDVDLDGHLPVHSVVEAVFVTDQLPCRVEVTKPSLIQRLPSRVLVRGLGIRPRDSGNELSVSLRAVSLQPDQCCWDQENCENEENTDVCLAFFHS